MAARSGGMGTARTDPLGRCLGARCSWLLPVVVHALAVRGVARLSISVPQPRLGRWQSGGGFLGAERGVVQAAEERREIRPGRGGSEQGLCLRMMVFAAARVPSSR